MSSISSKEEDSDRILLSDDEGLDNDIEHALARHTGSRFQRFRKHILFLIFHTTCFIAYVTILRAIYAQPVVKKWPTEPESVEDYIEYEDTQFNLTMFWDEDPNREVSPYEGPLTPVSEAHWDDLTRYMRAGITAKENERLSPPSVVSVDDDTVYPVVVSVFHHLHCLTRLRRIAWGRENPQNENEYVSIKHTAHCIEDLRKAIMCMPDTTLYPLKYTEWTKSGVPRAYEAQTNVPHTCRNWNRIVEWASIGGKKIEALPNFPPP